MAYINKNKALNRLRNISSNKEVGFEYQSPPPEYLATAISWVKPKFQTNKIPKAKNLFIYQRNGMACY